MYRIEEYNKVFKTWRTFWESFNLTRREANRVLSHMRNNWPGYIYRVVKEPKRGR